MTESLINWLFCFSCPGLEGYFHLLRPAVRGGGDGRCATGRSIRRSKTGDPKSHGQKSPASSTHLFARPKLVKSNPQIVRDARCLCSRNSEEVPWFDRWTNRWELFQSPQLLRTQEKLTNMDSCRTSMNRNTSNKGTLSNKSTVKHEFNWPKSCSNLREAQWREDGGLVGCQRGAGLTAKWYWSSDDTDRFMLKSPFCMSRRRLFEFAVTTFNTARILNNYSMIPQLCISWCSVPTDWNAGWPRAALCHWFVAWRWSGGICSCFTETLLWPKGQICNALSTQCFCQTCSITSSWWMNVNFWVATWW